MRNLLLVLFLNTLRFLWATDVTSHPNWNLLDHENCGESVSDRIIGGKQAALGEFPWMIRIGYNRVGYFSNKKITFKCGGSLINSLYVLTAAHCVKGLDGDEIAVVRVGEYDANSPVDCQNNVCAPRVQDFQAEKIIPHEKYQTPKMRNDIALIRLNRPVRITAYATPICLPHGGLLTKDQTGSTMHVAGWGMIDSATAKTSPVLLHVGVPIVPLEKCKHALSSFAPIGEGQLCAGGEKGRDSCGGDSGGPIMAPAAVDGPPKYFQFGVVSFGASECGSDLPAVYTEVSKYVKWILDNITY